MLCGLKEKDLEYVVYNNNYPVTCQTIVNLEKAIGMQCPLCRTPIELSFKILEMYVPNYVILPLTNEILDKIKYMKL